MMNVYKSGKHNYSEHPKPPQTQPKLGGTGKLPPVKCTATSAPKPEPGYQKDILKTMMSSVEKYAGLVKRYNPFDDKDFRDFEKWLAKQEEERQKKLVRLEKDFQKYFKTH